MKKLILLSLLAGSGLFGMAQRNCGTVEYNQWLESNDPSISIMRQQIEEQTATFVENFRDGAGEVAVTIPVVVHVVYNNATENISDARILEQIAVLNEDFRKLNADASNVPAAWSSIAADFEINFCLATIDPTGAATTGITRTSTSITSFTDDDAVKFNSSGGKDIWDRNKYLNLWVCDLGSSLLGYAQFPGGPANTDGVVMHYAYFGKTGATAPYNKGRTGTHEVGHWLNLYHIWGDDCGNGDGVCSSGSECSGSDAVSDTPNQCEMTYGSVAVGTVKTDGCTPSSPGVMWMNYMDYTNDASMYMFTSGQKARAQALFASGGARFSLTTSNGCSTGGPTYCTSLGSSTADEWIQTVAVGTNTNNSGNNSGYGNFTALNWTITKGVSTSFTLTPGFSGTAYPEYWKIWIDLNNDKDFADAGELVYDAGATSTAVRTGSFTVPTSATATATRMRVSMKYNGSQTACETFSYGEVEDYGVTLSSGGAGCSSPSGLSAGSITSSGATLSWTAVGGATSYNIQYRVNGTSTWSTVTSTTNSRSLTGLSASTTYNWQVQTVCSGGTSSYVTGTNFTTSAAACTDTYETNETNATAKTITVNTNIPAKICTSTDVDWYKFTTTTAAPKVRVTLTTLPADYDIYLYNSGGTTTLGSSTNGGTTSETITYNTPTTGATYSIRVYGYMGAFNTTTSYTLRASAQASNWARTSGEEETTPKEEILVPATDFLMAYPNPTADYLNLNYVSSEEGNATFSMVDLMGREVMSASRVVNVGENFQVFDLSSLPTGVYFARVATAKGVQTVKVQVSH